MSSSSRPVSTWVVKKGSSHVPGLGAYLDQRPGWIGGSCRATSRHGPAHARSRLPIGRALAFQVVDDGRRRPERPPPQHTVVGDWRAAGWLLPGSSTHVEVVLAAVAVVAEV